MSGWNIADALAAIGEVAPDRDAIVHGVRRHSWRELVDRSARFGRALHDLGVGRQGVDVPPWESPHDHVALYLTNSPEYLEAMVGAWFAGGAAVNVNYRYTPPELVQLLGDARAVAVVYHRRFGPSLAEALDDLPTIRHLVDVDDGSGVQPLPGSVAWPDLVARAAPGAPPVPRSGDDRYVVYTGGTTGNPKGVLWRQDDFVATALGITGTIDDLVTRAQRPRRPIALPAPPFMHGAAHWNALSCLLAGGTVVIQPETDHFDPADVLDTCARERVGSLLIVGDAFARPLLDELRRTDRDLAALRFLMTGGAVLSPAIKAAFLDELPDLRIVDILGSSETGRHGISTTESGTATDAPVRFDRSTTTVVLDQTRTRTMSPGDPGIGWLAQAGRVPLGYLHDRPKTEATFPVIDGTRYAIAGDRARLDAEGRIELLGRDSVTINTGGEKVHAEEVEQALKADPQIYDALVVGRDSERWGSEVVAVVAPAGDGFDPALAGERIRARLARYKVPKDYVVVEAIVRSPSGKPDYAWARSVVTERPVRRSDG